MRVEPVRRLNDDPSAVVILAHGGRADSREPTRNRQLTYLWQLAHSRSLARALTGTNVQIWRLRYRYRGWNGSAQDPVHDLRWAIDHASGPVVLVGHSMGGRACTYAASSPKVMAVCLLAPWLEPGDPVENLSGRPTLIIHGSADRMTSAERSHAAAQATGASYLLLPGAGHAMISPKVLSAVASFVREAVTNPVGGEESK